MRRQMRSALRQQLTTLEETLVNEEQDAATFCLSSLSVETQLALTHWLAESQWRQWIDAKGEASTVFAAGQFSSRAYGAAIGQAETRDLQNSPSAPPAWTEPKTKIKKMFQ